MLPGRSEGRVLECLKRLALINIRRDGSIMIRKYPGKVPEGISVASGSIAGGAQHESMERWHPADGNYAIENWNSQDELPPTRDIYRFLSANVSCLPRSESRRSSGTYHRVAPVVYVAG